MKWESKNKLFCDDYYKNINTHRCTNICIKGLHFCVESFRFYWRLVFVCKCLELILSGGLRIYWIICREVKPLIKRGAWVMTLNCIWWWGSCSAALGNVEYPFIAIIFRYILAQSSSMVTFMHQADPFTNY